MMIFQLIFYFFWVKFCCRGDLTFKEIQLKIADYNSKEYILNGDIYGPLTNESIVVIIQVHNRIEYLGYVIESHSKAKGIEDTLLIFSHDYYDDKINDLIQSITFCKVMQIFYPFSHQLYPFEYSKNRTSCEKCSKTKPSLMQVKHHWWWKINKLFTYLFATKYFKGLVIFLEDDHYVLEDYLYTVKLLNQKCEQLNCSFFSLTSYNNNEPREDKVLNVAISKFPTSTGLVFNRTTWGLIKNCGDKFCQINDYNWDWSLLHLIKEKCIKPYPKTLVSLTPKVLHIGNCGIHHKNNKTCSPKKILQKYRRKMHLKYLYPEKIHVFKKTVNLKLPKPFGGWHRKADQILCKNMM